MAKRERDEGCGGGHLVGAYGNKSSNKKNEEEMLRSKYSHA